MHITTRLLQEDDLAFAREAHHLAYHDVVVRQFGQWDEAVQDGFFERSMAEGGRALILLDDQPCGYAYIEPRADDIHLCELVIHPRFQGRGIGTAVLQTVCAQAAARGVPVRLGTFHTNRAITLYQRLGFQVFDQTATHVLMVWHP